MTGIEIMSKIGGRLVLAKELFHGNEGAVFSTDNDSILVKVYDPRDVPESELAAKRAQKEQAIATFINLLSPAVKSQPLPELSCLPQEYLGRVKDTPCYLMNYAQGTNLEEAIGVGHGENKYHRYLIGFALADALHSLHNRFIVHADLKPDNYVLNKQDGEYTVYVLDIDGGGYCGPYCAGSYCSVLPTVLPQPPYYPPEFVHSACWETLWQAPNRPTQARQPDLWGLAVLLYRCIVDLEGPFPTRGTRQLDSDLPDYEPYQRREWAGVSAWPKAWQRELMTKEVVSDGLVDAFVKVFDGQRDIVQAGKQRPTANEWKTLLASAIEGARPSLSPIASPVPDLSRRTVVLPPVPPASRHRGVDYKSPSGIVPRAGGSTKPNLRVCSQCGASNSPTEIYCQVCSHTLGGTRPCPVCQRQIPTDAVFCPVCGKKTGF